MGALGILGTLRSVNMYIKKIDTLSIFALFASAFNIFVGINNVLKHGNLFMISVNFSCAIFTGFLAVSFTMRR
jgi:hypothetical protein